MSEVLPLAARVGEAEVHVFRLMLLDELENLLRIGHDVFLG